MTTGNVTSYYYLGERLVAMSENNTLRYVHQDHLTGTALVTSNNGASLGTMKYYPYGYCRNSTGDLGTDKLFTGQRLDGTGLYYYGARYYDPTIGRFISADSIVPDPYNPQAFNRYSYALNNPLRYNDPSGHWVYVGEYNVRTIETCMEYYFMGGTPDQEIVNAVNSPEFQGYDAFREEYTYRASALEESERIITIKFDDLGYQPYSTTRKNGDNYEIILNNNPYNNLNEADSWFLGAQISKQVENRVLVCYPNSLNKDTMPDPIELIPYIGEINYITDLAHYRWGWTDEQDLTVSTISTGIGLYNPVLGYFGIVGEMIYKMWKYEEEFYSNVEKYGYSFR